MSITVTTLSRRQRALFVIASRTAASDTEHSPWPSSRLTEGFSGLYLLISKNDDVAICGWGGWVFACWFVSVLSKRNMHDKETVALAVVFCVWLFWYEPMLHTGIPTQRDSNVTFWGIISFFQQTIAFRLIRDKWTLIWRCSSTVYTGTFKSDYYICNLLTPVCIPAHWSP